MFHPYLTLTFHICHVNTIFSLSLSLSYRDGDDDIMAKLWRGQIDEELEKKKEKDMQIGKPSEEAEISQKEADRDEMQTYKVEIVESERR